MLTAFEPYKNNLGFFSDKPEASSGNDLLFSAEAIQVMRQNQAWTLADHEAMVKAVRTYSQIEPGLFGRPGWMQDQEQLDDYIGLATIDSAFAAEAIDYGTKHYWIFPTGKNFQWYEPLFFRWPAMIAHLYWCAGRKPCLLIRPIWCLSVAFSGSVESLDSWKLNYLLTVGVKDKGGIFERLAVWNWRRRLRKTFGSMKTVYAAYFGANDPRALYFID